MEKDCTAGQAKYEGWNFNSGNVVTSIVYNPLPAMWKSKDTFSSACCVDSSNGAVYCLKNLWNSSEANATKWFLHLRNQVEVTRASTGAVKGILRLSHRWQRVVHNAGDYIEGQ